MSSLNGPSSEWVKPVSEWSKTAKRAVEKAAQEARDAERPNSEHRPV